MNSLKIIATGSHPELGENLVKLVGQKVAYQPGQFANTETRVQLGDNVRNSTVVIVASGAPPVNDSLMEALLLADTCRRSGASQIFMIMAYFPYSRQDKKDTPRTPISGKVVLDMIENVGVDRLITLDLHAGQMQGFTNMPFDNLYAKNTFIKYFQETLFKGLSREEIIDKYLLISPDNGGTKRIVAYAKSLQIGYAVMDKRRDYTKPNVVMESTLVSDVDVKDKIGIIIDDMTDTSGTLVAASEPLKDHGLESVIVVVTHGVLSGPATERLENCSFIKKVIVADTLPQEGKKLSKLEVVQIAPLLRDVLQNLVDPEGSVSSLFV